MTEHTRALLAEIAGTFLFITIGAGAVVTASISAVPGTGLLAIALARGLALAIAVSAFGVISGGHFNPAVTFALAIATHERRRCCSDSAHAFADARRRVGPDEPVAAVSIIARAETSGGAITRAHLCLTHMFA